jgi:hypothetical protein
MKKHLLLTLIAIVSLVSGGFAQLNGSYTINGSVVTGGSNYQTFTAAVTALTTLGVNGPVTFTVAAGTYTEQISLPSTITGVSATNTITFNGGSGNASTRILQFAFGSLTNYAVVDLNGADYVTFRNLTIKSTSTTYGWGFNLRNQANYNTIDSCIIDMSACTSGTSTSVLGICFSNSATSATSTGNNANYCLIRNNTIIGGASGGTYRGINFYGSTSNPSDNTGNQILNNTIQDFYESGIYTYYWVSDIIIRGNDISRPNRTTSTTLYGIQEWYGYTKTIDGNKIHNMNGGFTTNTNTLYGLYSYNVFGSGSTGTVTMNNAVYDMSGAGTMYGILTQYCYYNKFYNNSISFDLTSTYSGTIFGIYSYFGNSSNTGYEWKNNIVSVTRPGSGTRYGFYEGYNTNFYILDKNVYYVNASGATNYIGYNNGSNLTTWAAYKAAFNPQEQNSLNINPSYTNITSNLTPQNCLLDNYGASGTGVTKDITGATRGTLIDIGAYEFSAGANNASVTGVVSPSNGICTPGSQTVTVTITNFGSATLTSDSLYWWVNGTAQTPVAWTGSVATGATANVTLGTYSISAGTVYNFVVRTAAPNGSADICAGNDTLQFSRSIGLSGTYTINPSGSGSSNFTTFSAAITALTASGVCGPVIFNVAAATYAEQISIPPINGTSATNTITFNGGSGNATSRIISYGYASIANYGIVDLNGADYIIFKNITVRSTNANYGWGFLLRNQANYNTIDSCIIDLGAVTTTGSNSIGICVTGSATSWSTTANSANYCNFTNNTILGSATGGSYIGISIYGSTSSMSDNTKILIANNSIQDFYYCGIYTYFYADSMTVRGNDISRPNRTNSTTLYGIQYGYYATSRITDGNKIHNLNGGFAGNTNTVNGIYTQYSFNYNNVFRNNAIYDVQGVGPIYGIYDYYCYGDKFYHNTISLDNTVPMTNNVYGIYYYAGTTFVNGQDFKNNIVTISKPGVSGTGTRYGFYSQDNSNYTSDNNIYLMSSTGSVNYYGYYSGINYPTFANWQARSIANEQNSLSLNPSYSNLTTNLAPTNCAANNTGVAVGVTTDINGTARSSSLPDAGAYEVSLGGANDVGVTMGTLSGFTAGVCSGTSTVTATIRNYGTNTLTSATINWSINGSAQTPYSFSGSLAPGASTTVTVGTFSINSGILYTVIITGASPNASTDACSGNDNYTVIAGAGMAGTYTINPAGTGTSNYPTFTAAVADLNVRGVCGPVVFNVAAGTYTEQISIPQVLGSSATNYITFKSATGVASSVVLTFNSTVAANYLVDFNGADFVSFKNITFTATNTTYGIGMQFRNVACRDSVSGCIFNGVITTSVGTNLSLIYASSTNDSVNTFIGNTFNNGSYGFYYVGSSTVTKVERMVISSNTFRGQYASPVYLNYADRTQIVDNTISSTSPNSVNYMIYNTNALNGFVVTKNKLNVAPAATSGSYYGIYNTIGTSPSPITDSSLVANNEIIMSSAFVSFYGIYQTSSVAAYSRVYNNSVLIGAAGTLTSYAAYFSSTTGNCRFLNNVLINRRTGTTAWALYKSNDITSMSDYNLLYSAGTNLANNGTNYTTLAAWNASANTPDLNSFNKLPYFSNPNSLIISEGCFDNKGTPNAASVNTLASVPKDITGANRGATPDFGAYEFSGNAYDLAVTAVTSPAAYSASPQTVTFRVRNNGSVAITSFDAGYNVNNGTNNNETFTIGTLNGCDSTTLSFTNQVTFPSGVGMISLAAFVRGNLNGTNGDVVRTNDTAWSNPVCNGGLSGTYTINSSVPASSSNFVSFASAIASLTSCGVSGPVTFNVAAGVYNEQVTIPQVTGVSATNTITFDGGAGNAASRIIQYNFASLASYAVITLNGADYITIKNLTIRSNNPNYGWGVRIANANGTAIPGNPANNNTISDCIIDLGLTTAVSTNICGIVFSASATSTTSGGNHSNNTTIRNNTILGAIGGGAYYGISLYGYTSNTGYNTNIQIINNNIQDFYNAGIYVQYYFDGMIVRGNDISRPNRSSSTTLYGIYAQWYYTNSIFDGNKIHNLNGNFLNNTNSVFGIYDYFGTNSQGNNVVRNNAIYDIQGSGQVYGIYSYYNWGKILNNTISLDNTASSYTGTMYGIYYYIGNLGTISYGQELKNNIISVTKPGGTRYGIFVADNTVSSIDNNVIWVNGIGSTNYIGYWQPSGSGVNYTTFASWQARNSSLDQNSYNVNPSFSSLTINPIPTNCLLDNAAAVTSYVTTDITGASRSSAPDLGAYEFNASGANNASIIALASPSGIVCSGTQNIVAILKNKGGSTLTSAKIDWSVNGTGQTQFNWSGSLAPGATANVTIGSLNFTTNASYVLKVYSGLPNGSTDGCSLDDTLNITKGSGMSGVYTIDAAGSGSTNYTSFANAISALLSNGVCGPVNFNVAAGTYSGQLVIPIVPGSSSLNTVTFDGSAGNAATRVITYTSTGTSYAGIYLNGADYIRLKNLTIRSLGSGNNAGIQFANGADYNIVDNCIVDLSSVSMGVTSACINFSSSPISFSSSANHGNYNIIRNSSLKGGATGGPYYAINLYYGSTAYAGNKYNSFINNDITDFFYAGIYQYYGMEGTTITDNRISRPTISGGSSPVYGIFNYFYNHGDNISRNRIFNPYGGMPGTTNTFYGIYTYYNNATSPYMPSVVANNAVYNLNGNGQMVGIYGYSNYDLKIAHNTIVLDSSITASSSSSFGIWSQYMYSTGTTNSPNIIRNNMIRVSRPSTANNAALYIDNSTSSTLPQVDNNIYYIGGGSNNYFVYYTPTATYINSITTWKSTTTPNSYDANSFVADPQFVAMTTGNLKPTNTAVNNTGANLTVLVSNDINQGPRSATPDAGAYEWGPVCSGFPAVNGVSMIASGQPLCSGSTAQLTVSFDVVDSLSFQWQESNDNTNWTNVTGGSGANSYLYTTAPITAPKYYRCKVTCTVSGSSTNSTSYMVRNALSGVYTINSGSSTSGTNYNLFADVVNDLKTFGVCGSVTFNVAAGTYNEQVILGNILGVSASSQITFNGLGSSTVVASTLTNATDYGVIHLNGTDYVTFNNLTVKADNPNQGFGFLLSNGADYVTIKNCTIDMSSVTNTGSTSSGICVSSSFTTYSGGGINANYLTIDGNRITGSASGGAYFGISLYDNTTGLGRNINNVIKNNYIADFFAYGIYSYYEKNYLVISGNTITRPNRGGSSSPLYGIYSYYNSSVTPTTIEKNRIVGMYNGSGSGTFYGIYSYSPTNIMNYVTNNIIHPGVTGGSNVAMYGIYMGTVYSLVLDHNTVIMSDTSNSNGSARYGMYLTGPPGSSVNYAYEVKNNLIHMTTPGGTSYGLYMTASTSVTSYNYAANYNNLWVEPFGGVGTKYYAYLGGSVYTSMAAWKTNAWGYDVNGTNMDAMFQPNYTPTFASLDNLGAPSASLKINISTDINNKSRKPATPDMGAIEWTPICVGADFVQGTPYQGTFRSGTVGDFDHLKAGTTVTYNVLPITGYTNASFGTAWTISNFSFATVNGSPAGSGQATFTNPGSANGALSFSPSQPYTDSTFLITFDIKSLIGAECITPISRYIYVAPVPVVDFDTTAVACFTTPLTIKNNTTLIRGNMTFLWNFGDTTSNNTSIQGTPTYTFSRPGSFTVNLTATSDLGYSTTKTKVINVYYLPQAKYDFQPGCLGKAVSFNNQSTIPGPPVSLSYNWNFGDNTSSSSTSPSKTYIAIGTYNVTLTTTSAQGCSTSVAKNVTIFPVPVVNFTATNPCKGENAIFSNGTTIAYGKIGYSWNFGDGTTDIVSDPVKKYTSQGTFNVKMVAYSEYGCKDSITKSVTIGTVPTAAFALTKWCDNDSASFSNSSTANGGPSITSLWNFGDLTTSNSSTPVINHMYPSAGYYQVVLVVTNGSCSDTAELNIEIEETPIANFAVTGGVCQGNATTFNNLSTGSDTLSYSWNFDGTGTSIAINPTYTFPGAGSFNVVLNVNSSNGCSNSVTKSVSVFGQPSAAFTTSWNAPLYKRQQAFYAGNQNLYSYNWNFGDGIGTSQQVNPVYSYFSDGPFKVKLRVADANGCTNESDTIIDFIKLSTGRINNNAFSFDVYPNPFRNNTTVNYTLEKAGEVELKVYDITGKEITTLVNATKQEVGSYKVNFDASGVNAKSGIYFIRLSVDGVVVSKQIIETK